MQPDDGCEIKSNNDKFIQASSLGELVQHLLLVLHVVSQASELLLMSLPLVLQLLLHTFLQGGNTVSRDHSPVDAADDVGHMSSP